MEINPIWGVKSLNATCHKSCHVPPPVFRTSIVLIEWWILYFWKEMNLSSVFFFFFLRLCLDTYSRTMFSQVSKMWLLSKDFTLLRLGCTFIFPSVPPSSMFPTFQRPSSFPQNTVKYSKFLFLFSPARQEATQVVLWMWWLAICLSLSELTR